MSKSFFMGLTDANQLLLEWRPPGAGLGGSLHPGLRRTACSSPGVMFVSPSGLGRALVWIVIFWPGRSTGAKWGSRVRNGEKLLVKVANISVTLTSNFYTVSNRNGGGERSLRTQVEACNTNNAIPDENSPQARPCFTDVLPPQISRSQWLWDGCVCFLQK